MKRFLLLPCKNNDQPISKHLCFHCYGLQHQLQYTKEIYKDTISPHHFLIFIWVFLANGSKMWHRHNIDQVIFYILTMLSYKQTEDDLHSGIFSLKIELEREYSLSMAKEYAFIKQSIGFWSR